MKKLYFIAIILLSSCKTFWPTDTKKSLGTFWLNKSMFAGQFCDHDNLSLIDYRPFKYLNNLKDTNNELCSVQQQDIIKAGTKAEIIEIKYTDQVLVFLKIARERGQVSFFRDNLYVFLMPDHVIQKEEVRKYLSQFLTNKDPNPWLITQKEYIQKAIWSKEPAFGMNREHLKAALGLPLSTQKLTKTSINEEQELWHYDNYIITLEEQEVIKINKISY